MKKLSVISFVVVIALLFTMGTALASQARTAYRAPLSGDTAGTGSDAHGNAVFIFSDDGSQLKYKLVVDGLENTLMAHIHVADVPNGNGPIVLWLYPDAPPPALIEGTFNGLLGSGTVAPSNLTGAAGVTSFKDLRMAIEEGKVYVNVHTLAFPGGEIRGYIR